MLENHLVKPSGHTSSTFNKGKEETSLGQLHTWLPPHPSQAAAWAALIKALYSTESSYHSFLRGPATSRVKQAKSELSSSRCGMIPVLRVKQ